MTHNEIHPGQQSRKQLIGQNNLRRFDLDLSEEEDERHFSIRTRKEKLSGIAVGKKMQFLPLLLPPPLASTMAKLTPLCSASGGLSGKGELGVRSGKGGPYGSLTKTAGRKKKCSKLHA